MTLATRRLDEMTSREVEFYLRDGGDLIFVPFGPISGHGALIPMGMHAHWAEALGTLMARKANGLVYPAVFQAYSGATRTFRGAVSFPIQDNVDILSHIALTLHAQGFKRVVLVAGTWPESLPGTVAARTLFDETEIPFWLIVGEKALDVPEVRAIYEGYPGNFGETLLELASLKILGRERPIPCAEWAKELHKYPEGEGDQPEEIRQDKQTLGKWGAIGFRYYEEKNHGNHGTAGLEFRGRSDIDMAVEVLEKSADAILPALDNFAHYCEWLEKHPFRYITATDRLDVGL